MKIKNILLCIFASWLNIGTSQELTIKGSDTSVVVSLSQIRIYNHIEQDYIDCNVMADTLYAQKERYKSVNKDMANEIEESDAQISNLKDQVVEKEITEASYKKGEKRAKVKVKILKGIATGFGVIAILEAGWIYLSTLLSN